MKKKIIIFSAGFLFFITLFYFVKDEVNKYVFTNISEQIVKSNCDDNININNTKCINKSSLLFLKICGIKTISYSKNYSSIWFNSEINVLGFSLFGNKINYSIGKYKNLNNSDLPKYENKNGGYWIEKKYNDNMVLIKDSL